MSDEAAILFSDTNGFLQIRDLKDIPWNELVPGVKAVDVMVARASLMNSTSIRPAPINDGAPAQGLLFNQLIARRVNPV